MARGRIRTTERTDSFNPAIPSQGGKGTDSYPTMNDFKFAFRQLLKNPGFTAVAVLTLALGIGANTAMFSVINAVLLRSLPYPNSDRLVQIWQTNPRANRWGAWVSYPDFLDWRQQNTTFEEVGAFRPWGSTSRAAIDRRHSEAAT